MPWFVQLIGFLLLGTVVVIGAVLTLPYFITKWLGHDQSTCECWDCQNRRTRSLRRRQETEEENRRKAARKQGRNPNLPMPHYVPEEKKEVRDPKDYWSTEELRTGYHVFVKGVVYEIGTIKTLSLETGDTKVQLFNILTKNYTFIVITGNMKQSKVWRKGFGQDLWK